MHFRATDKKLTEVPSLSLDVESVYLFGNALTSISLSLPKLNILHLQENNISSVELSQCSSLEKLYLDFNKLVDINLPSSIVELSLANQSVSLDLAQLATLTRLQTLDISYCKVSDLSALASCPCLTNLTATGNNISTLKSIMDLSTTLVTFLDLTGNPIQTSRHYREEVIFVLKSLEILDQKEITSRDRQVSEALVAKRYRNRNRK
ncbi:hypothetical protein P9112_009650 [Eukaryota sp. TZLM1-RC]